MFEFIGQKFADIIFYFYYFIQNKLLKKKNQVATFFIQLLHSVHFREILSGYFLFSVLIGQYLSRNWLLNI
jgi:hypothetical protein